MVLVLVLVALIVFFVVGQGLGAQQRSGIGDRSELDSLKERFLGGVPRVGWPPGDCCSKVLMVRPCELAIPKGKGLLRKVSAGTDKPMLVKFVPASTPDRTVTLDMTEDQSKPAELYVDRKGGRLTLVCMAPDAAGCTVVVN